LDLSIKIQLFNNLSTYPPAVSDFAIPVIIGIIALAVPILVQTISSIDKKYDSQALVNSFIRDWRTISFVCVVILAIVALVLWILQIPRFCDFGPHLNYFLDDILNPWLVIISAILLLVSSTFLFYLIIIFNIPNKLLKLLRKRYDFVGRRAGGFGHSSAASHFREISSLFYFSIKTNNDDLSRRCYAFFKECVVDKRMNTYSIGVKDVIYSDSFYDMIFTSNDILCGRDSTSRFSLNSFALYDMFFDYNNDTYVSEKSFNSLWHCLSRDMIFGKDEFIFSYWTLSNQYFQLYLRPLEPKFGDKLSIINNKEIKERENRRKIFREFHFALGALLLYSGKYALLKRLMFYTTTQPPRYFLVPETLKDVVTTYVSLTKPTSSVLSTYYFENRYPFPIDNTVEMNSTVEGWIKRYLSILFLRQYFIEPLYFENETFELPDLPNDKPTMNLWKRELTQLKYFIDGYLKERNTLIKLGFGDVLDTNWLDENNKVWPDILIDNYLNKLERAIDYKDTHLEIDSDKVKGFIDNSKNIISKCYTDTDGLFSQVKGTYTDNIVQTGQNVLFDKKVFSKEQDVDYLNAYSITAESVAQNFKMNIIKPFFMMGKIKFLLDADEIIRVLDSIVGLYKQKHLIIDIGLDLSIFQDISKKFEKKDGRWSFNNVPIIEIQGVANFMLYESFLIIRESDLPYIEHCKPDDALISKYKLVQIDGTSNVYASIIDLSEKENKVIAEEVCGDKPIDTIANKVLACIAVKNIIHYNKAHQVLQLKLFQQFIDKERKNNVSDVKKYIGV
jgi:hypothetical protein